MTTRLSFLLVPLILIVDNVIVTAQQGQTRLFYDVVPCKLWCYYRCGAARAAWQFSAKLFPFVHTVIFVSSFVYKRPLSSPIRLPALPVFYRDKICMSIIITLWWIVEAAKVSQ